MGKETRRWVNNLPIEVACELAQESLPQASLLSRARNAKYAQENTSFTVKQTQAGRTRE